MFPQKKIENIFVKSKKSPTFVPAFEKSNTIFEHISINYAVQKKKEKTKSIKENPRVKEIKKKKQIKEEEFDPGSG